MKDRTFDDLSLVDKAWLIHEFAETIMSIEYYDERIFLYGLNGHFIELYYNIETRQIHRISLANYSDLDKYLSRILITSLKTVLR